MQKIIGQITDQLVGLIKKDQSSYTPQQLLKAGIPTYIVERVRLLLEDKVLSELHEPSSIWIEADNELLKHAWDDFKTTAFSSSVIPHDKLYEVLHQTIGDIISVFVEPRKNMANYLFRTETVLSFDEMTKRCARLTIYKHFGTAIPLYMQKRELNVITLERCQKLISNLDARIVSNYTAENWAQKLELLFTLFGGKLDPNLLSLFFADKGFEKASKMFSSIDVAVTQSTFIEMLSNEQMTVTQSVKETNEEVAVDATKKKTKDSKEEDVENLASAFRVEDADQDMNAILGDITEEGLVEEDNIEEAKSLNALFVSDDEEEAPRFEPYDSKEEDQKELRSNLSSILGEAKNSYEGVVNEEAESEEIVVEEELIEDPVEELESEEKEDLPLVTQTQEEERSAEEGEEEPMWAQFLSKDQMDVMMSKREEDKDAGEESVNDSIFVEDEDDELIIDDKEETSDTIPLNGYLHEKEAQWIKILFNGKDKEYHSTIKEIEKLKNWEQASGYVETQIFSKEHVDMFSEEAIEFIDALQTFFKKYKS